ncbi:integrase family protein [Opitutus terrae PB90-1]|uniref:Integrase family protein n=1 Tax=Opitutus terrae (strain DSM 11246 / JCM 15787 / PB90-1) TaxID=452637 RepID=B1ZPL5_OPITP|nr:integrase family protein [Opitutus terrae PB90-1]
MACVWRHPKSPFWFARFKASPGVFVNRSTKETNRKKAEEVARSYEEAGQRLGRGEHHMRVIRDVAAKYFENTAADVSFKTYTDIWLKRKATEEVSPGTLTRYRQIAEAMGEFLGPRIERNLVFLSAIEVQTFRDLIGARLSAKSANIYLKTLRILLGEAWRDGHVIENVANKVKTLKVRENQTARRPFTTTQIEILLSHAPGEWKGIILFGFYTAQRLGDIASLSWSQVDLEKAVVHFKTAKTHRTVEVPLADPLLAFLKRLPAPERATAPVFPKAHAIVTKEGRTGSLSNQFHEILTAAKLAEKRTHHADAKAPTGRSGKRQTSALSFHSLRHSATSALKREGVNDATARDIVGHESRAISEHYTHIDTETKRRAIAKLPVLIQPDQ